MSAKEWVWFRCVSLIAIIAAFSSLAMCFKYISLLLLLTGMSAWMFSMTMLVEFLCVVVFFIALSSIALSVGFGCGLGFVVAFAGCTCLVGFAFDWECCWRAGLCFGIEFGSALLAVVGCLVACICCAGGGVVVAGSFLPFAFGAFAGMAVGLLLCTCWEVGVDTVCAGCLRCCCIGLVGTVVLLAAGFGAVAVVAGSLG